MGNDFTRHLSLDFDASNSDLPEAVNVGLAIDDYPFSDFYNHLRMCKQMEGSTEIMKIVMAREILGK